MTLRTPPPQDQRMRKIRRQITRVERHLDDMQSFVDGVPKPMQAEVQKALRQAFEVGCDFQQLQSLPLRPPVDEQGMLKMGPALRDHILETRKIYGDVDQLREIVADLFDEKSSELLKRLVREQGEQMTGTGVAEFEIQN